MSDRAERPEAVLIIGDDPWRSVVHAVIDHPAMGRGLAAPVAMVGVSGPSPASLRAGFVDCDAEAFASYCELAIWQSTQILCDGWRRIARPGGRIVLTEFVPRNDGNRYAVDDAVTDGRRALVASAAARWRGLGVTIFMVTLAVDPADYGPPGVEIGPEASDLIALLISGRAASLSGQSFTP